MTDDRRCPRCAHSLRGLRRDARWCSSRCRTLAYRERRAVRETREAIRVAVRLTLTSRP